MMRLASGVVTVLAIAAIAFVVRGTLASTGLDDTKLPPGITASAHDAPSRFRLGQAGHNVFPKTASTIATAKHRSIVVYAKAPNATQHKPATRRLHQRVFNKQQIALTFLVRSRRKGWVEVELPTRPNQSSGWMRRKDLDLTFTTLRIVINRNAHVLRLYDADKLIINTKIAVGKALSPTPRGRYFITDVVQTKQPKGLYGPYALGLSAHSTVYTSFEGGNGQVGVHGTNAPASIGSDVSHGCIRVPNAVITRLAKIVPLGTPVTIKN